MKDTPLIAFTLVLNGHPWLPHTYTQLCKLDFPWTWVICEGTAANTGSTKWCAKIEPGHSTDGTLDYLDSIQFDPRVKIWKCLWWPGGKDEMANAVFAHVPKSDYILMQIDSDELWQVEQLTRIRHMFLEHPKKNAAFFYCRYFLGRDIVITNRGNNYGNYTSYEWLRAWHLTGPHRYEKHEPPVIAGLKLNAFTHAETEREFLVFDHHSWSTEAQVEFKSRFYGAKYKNAVAEWKKLQANQKWPTDAHTFCSWIPKGAIATRI